MYDDDDGDALVSLVPRADYWWLVFCSAAGVALYFYRTTFWFYREDFVYILGAIFLWQLNKFVDYYLLVFVWLVGQPASSIVLSY